jgi:hypothetical protein
MVRRAGRNEGKRKGRLLRAQPHRLPLDQAGNPVGARWQPPCTANAMALGDCVTHRQDATIQHVGAGLYAPELDIRVTLELRSQ